MTVYRGIERFADPVNSKTPVDKAPDPQLGTDFIDHERYISPEFAKHEWDRVWTKTWLIGADIDDLSHPGDFIVTELGRQSIVLTRDEDGGVNAFFNVCSHRGNQVACEASGNQKAFRCSYHAWTYNLRGELINVPDQESFTQGAPREKLSIQKLPCAEWGRWVWFSLDPDIEPLKEFLGPIPEHLDPYHFDRWARTEHITVEWDCNWKTCVDAFNESYHVLETHPQIQRVCDEYNVQIDCYEKHSRYLIPFGSPSSHLKDDKTIDDSNRGWMLASGLNPDDYEGDAAGVRRALQLHIRESALENGYDFADMNDDQLTDDYHYFAFPNVTFNLFHTRFSMFRQRPHETDPNKMYFDLMSYELTPMGSDKPECPPHRQFKNGDEPYNVVYEQDAANCEKQQKGFHQIGFRGMWISDQELRVRHFHKVLDDYMN